MNARALPRTLLIAFLLLLLPAATALAHGTHTGAAETFTQSVGPYELAITLENTVTPTPAPLYLTVAPQAPLGDAVVELRAAPRGQRLHALEPLEVGGLPDPLGRFYAEAQLTQGGDWELEVRVRGSLGSGVARIPFTITPPVLPPYTVPLLATLGGVLALLFAGVVMSLAYGRLGRPTPRWANWLIGQGLFACLIAGAIFGWQQIADALRPAQQASGLAGGGGRPHANMELASDPPQPVAGQPLTLTLELSDGSTGQPLDDLVPHHEALMHLVVLDEGGAFFRHLHPARVAPGRFAIALTPDRAGRFTAYAEIARLDSGSQVLSQPFAVGGPPTPASQPAPGLGTQELGGGAQATVTASGPLRAGRQATLTFSFRAGGEPVRDLQLWLGMPGHLIARRSDGALFSHVHAAEVVPSDLEVDPATLRYGPDIRFAYTFPQPGIYQVWAQVRRGGAILTAPITLEVQP
jgi:hypothetical protein